MRINKNNIINKLICFADLVVHGLVLFQSLTNIAMILYLNIIQVHYKIIIVTYLNDSFYKLMYKIIYSECIY